MQVDEYHRLKESLDAAPGPRRSEQNPPLHELHAAAGAAPHHQDQAAGTEEESHVVASNHGGHRDQVTSLDTLFSEDGLQTHSFSFFFFLFRTTNALTSRPPPPCLATPRTRRRMTEKERQRGGGSWPRRRWLRRDSLRSWRRTLTIPRTTSRGTKRRSTGRNRNSLTRMRWSVSVISSSSGSELLRSLHVCR